MPTLRHARLDTRALVAINGADWRGFLQGLLTQDVDTLAPGELRFSALLSPPGRMLFDLFVVGEADGCLLDVEASRREALIQRLTLYRLRAKVTIIADDRMVGVLFPGPLESETGWVRDPRLSELGLRGYGAAVPPDAQAAEPAAYEAHRLSLGVPGAADFGEDKAYPIEANVDLMNGIDFKKGCFVGQETTSRMKRRGQIKSRMALLGFEGEAPAFGAEVLAGELRAGQVLSGAEGQAMALMRLDRMVSGPLTVDGREARILRAPE